MIGSPLNRNKSSKGKPITEDDIPRLHHDLMCTYGWIPMCEFNEIPIKTVLKLHKLIQEDKQSENEYRKAVLKGLGYKI